MNNDNLVEKVRDADDVLCHCTCLACSMTVDINGPKVLFCLLIESPQFLENYSIYLKHCPSCQMNIEMSLYHEPVKYF